jgi:SAM-dependent methyltransferase
VDRTILSLINFTGRDLILETSSPRSFDELIDAAMSEPIEGWDFSYLHGRVQEQPLPWDYPAMARELIAAARRVLDVDTGGGELFASLEPPEGSVAVEPYRPNVDVAARNLAARGVSVVERTDEALPVADDAFDLVLNRHGFLNAAETSRVLTAGGRMLTQQVGPCNDLEFNDALGVPPPARPAGPTGLEKVVEDLQAAGLTIIDAREANVARRYLDVGAVTFQLRMVSWQVPGFDPDRHRQQLRRMHDRIADDGWFEVHSQRFLVQAQAAEC